LIVTPYNGRWQLSPEKKLAVKVVVQVLLPPSYRLVLDVVLQLHYVLESGH
jgi:hypothetical protein